MIETINFDISQSVFSDSFSKPLRPIVKSSELFRHKDMKDTMLANCCLAGALLFYGFFTESHRLSQRINTSEGSYWHAILHRLEGDYSNSKYWFNKIPEHPTFDSIFNKLKELNLQSKLVDELLSETTWSPLLFVDLCEQYTTEEDKQVINSIGFIEWETLYEFCYTNGLR